jgi:O-antigen ligase
VTTQKKLGLPTIALALLITSLYYCLPLGRYSIFGFTSDFRIYDFAYFAFFIFVGISQLPRVQSLMRYPSNFHHWYFLLLIFVWVSLLLTYTLGGTNKLLPAIIRSFRFTAYLFTAAFVVSIVDTRRKYNFILKVIYLNIVIQAILAFFQGLKLIPNLWPSYWIANYGDIPVGTLSPHHKHIGVIMLLGIGVSLSFLRSSRSLIIRLMLIILIVIMIIVPILGGTRSVWLGLVAFAAAYLYMHKGRGLMTATLIVSGFLIIFWLGQDIIRDPVIHKINTRLIERVERFGFSGISEGRTNIYLEEIPATIKSSPWLLLTGTGFQNIAIYLGATGAHNNYLQVWLELGFLGFIIYMRFLLAILKKLKATAAEAHSFFERLLAQDVWVIFMAVLATMFVGETLWAQYSMFTLTGQIMVLVGLATCPLYWDTPEKAKIEQK